MRIYIADVFGDKLYENVLYATPAYDERYIFVDGKWKITKIEWLYHIREYDVVIDNEKRDLLDVVLRQVEKEKSLTVFKYKKTDYKKVDNNKIHELEESGEWDKIDEHYKSAEIEVKIRTSTLEDVYKYLSTLTKEQRSTPIVTMWDESGEIFPVKDVSKLFEVGRTAEGAIVL